MLTMLLPEGTAYLRPEHLIFNLFVRQNEYNFAKLFDDTLREIAILNSDIFSVKTGGGAQIRLFDALSQFISDPGERDNFCKAIINKYAGV